jgi:hypothetical protein
LIFDEEIFIFFSKDLDKNYNDKLCLEYELNASPVHLTTTDECILAALRKLSSLEQQVKKIFEPFLFKLNNECLDCTIYSRKSNIFI